MRSKQQAGGTGRFLIKQAVLLVITIALMVSFTIPLMKAVRAALSPGELKTNVDRSRQEVASLETRLDVVRSKMLMGAGEDDAQEKLKEEVEKLKRQVAAKEQENKNLQEQMALVRTMLEVVKAKPAATPVQAVDTSHTFFDLLAKIFGCIGSAFTGGMFVVSWWKNRRESAQAAER
ncbi:MAG TPA: hypothetical protein VK463_05030 [Desulfomonilaceae bacterium]|nr:hypothetical protein [Desulfomonilaceae bacterium]